MTFMYPLLPTVRILSVNDLERRKMWHLEERSVFSRVERPWVSGSQTRVLVPGRCSFREALSLLWASGHPPVCNVELSVSVSCCCITNHPTTEGFKTKTIY